MDRAADHRTLRELGRNAVRALGVATSPIRPLPDFLIIGAKRGGTTSLYRYLLQHPQVLPMFPSARRLPLAENQKGVHYFDTRYGRGIAWYRSHFASAVARHWAARQVGMPTVTGEASPYYLCHPLAARRAAEVVGSARLILLLRDPVERTFSHYREQLRNGVETLSFEEALRAEPGRLAAARKAGAAWGDSFAYEHQGYVTQSEYAVAVSRWLEVFPRSQLIVLRSEDLYVDPQGALDEVFQFLDLPPYELRDVRPWNVAPASRMIPSTRSKLRAHFAPQEPELAALLGRGFGWCG